MKKEFEECIYKYFYEDSQSFLPINLPKGKDGTKNDLIKILKNFDKLEFFDRPDGYILTKGYVYILEHFEIDATRLDRNGSQTRKEEFRIDKEFESMINKNVQEKMLYNEQMQIEISSKNLTNNFIKSYTNHYKKIGSYKNHLIEKGIANNGTKYKTCFFVEDVTPLGTFYLNNKICRTPLRISDIKECVQTLKENRVDYLFLLNQYDNDKSIYYLQKSWLKDISKKAMSCELISMLNWKPMDMRMSICFNKKDD